MHEKVVCACDYFVWCGAKKNSGTCISETTGAISFKFDMQGREYGPTKIYKFDRNRPNSFRATIG